MASSILELGKRLLKQGPEKIVDTPRRIRVLFAQEWIADSTSAVFVWEHPFYPQYYLPLSSVSATLSPWCSTEQQQQQRQQSAASHVDLDCGFELLQLSVRDQHMKLPVLAFKQDLDHPLAGLARVPFVEAEWFAEDEPVYVHPKDPTKRVEILHSQRPVRVFVRGHLLAASNSCFQLFETGLPTRYYLPKTAVHWKYLQPSSDGLTTLCPYKGEAQYYDVVLPPGEGEEGRDGDRETLKNLVWWYVFPARESAEIAGRVCFYNEKVDIELDGIKLDRPKTHFA